MKRFTMLILLFLIPGLISISFSKDKREAQKAFSLHIYSSTNLTGNLDPCG